MEQIGRYRTERVLGSGTFGTVWLARDEALDAVVAIKVLADNWARDESFRRRFLEEARILWRAESDQLIRVHTVDELPDGRPYFVMDYADRGSLQDRMTERFAAGGWFKVSEAMEVSLEIAAGLRVVHALGIAHRDLKPANVMYRSVPAHHGGDDLERLVLVDFGVARSLAAGMGTTIATGTPHYMAPEQAEGRADYRSDVYSAAVILYELLGRRVPYPYESIGELMRAQARSAFPPLSSVRGDVPPELEAVVASGLATDPADRFADAASWTAALTGQALPPPLPSPSPGPMGGETLGPEELQRARQSGAAPPRPPPPLPPAGPPGSGGPGGRPPKGRRTVVAGSALVVAILAAVIGVLVVSGGGDADGPSAAEVFLEPISSVGRDPFTRSVTPSRDELEDADSELAGLEVPDGELVGVSLGRLDLPEAGGRGVPVVTGDAPGLYGGTNLLSVCDADRLRDFLEENADKAGAWAEALDIDADRIGDFIDGLTDVVLRADTRVVNHGFTAGRANPINAVLQAGTAVLVDRFGVPKVRCKCGNPLLPAQPLANDVAVQGDPWPDFSLAETITVAAADAIEEFVLQDVLDESPLFRVTASPATDASDEPQILDPPFSSDFSTDSSSSEGPITSDPVTTTTEVLPADVTSRGIVAPSSTFDQPDGFFPASLAVDGDVGTSWFSAGEFADGDTSTYTWSVDEPVPIVRIEVLSNARHDDPALRTGFGFVTMTIEVFDVNGDRVYESADIPLAGTPDPDVSVELDIGGSTVRGTEVRISLTGHEDPTCGGFSELRILTS
ncbi:MAG: DUF6777 domain-containing protein [Acidimicrobiia bacterium]